MLGQRTVELHQSAPQPIPELAGSFILLALCESALDRIQRIFRRQFYNLSQNFGLVADRLNSGSSVSGSD